MISSKCFTFLLSLSAFLSQAHAEIRPDMLGRWYPDSETARFFTGDVTLTNHSLIIQGHTIRLSNPRHLTDIPDGYYTEDPKETDRITTLKHIIPLILLSAFIPQARAQVPPKLLGHWSPLSETARAITGDVILTDHSLIIKGHTIRLSNPRHLAQIPSGYYVEDQKFSNPQETITAFNIDSPANFRAYHKNIVASSNCKLLYVWENSPDTLAISFNLASTPEQSNPNTIDMTYAYIRPTKNK